VTRSYPVLLIALAALWGASYLFIKVAVDDIEPAPMMAIRLLGAAILLTAYVGVRATLAAWRPGLVLGVINAALPFWLVAWGEKHVDSSVAGIAQASVPVFVVLFSLALPQGERLGPSRLAGIAAGIAGVAVVTGIHPDGGWWAVAGTLAVVVSSVSYALASLYAKGSMRTYAGPALASSSMVMGALVLTPFALLSLPDHAPSLEAAGSLAALTLLGTVAAQLVLYRMLRLHGPARMSLVTYLMPVFAVAYGALLLDERLSPAAIGGLALILVGVALGSGAVKLPARESRAARAT
jgi:drug/metabolite transporter (DMT)-like permease